VLRHSLAHFIVRDYPEIFELIARRHLDWQASWRTPDHRQTKQTRYRQAYNALIAYMLNLNAAVVREDTAAYPRASKHDKKLALELSELKRLDLLKRSLYTRVSPC
jgi:hypothetical protein